MGLSENGRPPNLLVNHHEVSFKVAMLVGKKHILQSQNHMKLVHVGYTCHVWFVPPWLMLKFPTWIQAIVFVPL